MVGRLTVDRHDDVAGLDPGLLGGLASDDSADADPSVVDPPAVDRVDGEEQHDAMSMCIIEPAVITSIRRG